ncbi:PaaI family thioesterase [Pollutimonas harenae]|uniref:PaaI family thioesterase n=1 Tax=Pollutimonas harenae TaxID=657015 RepID=A0A853H2T7_9BURK|nr:PaaI family thioesterase [Pollutimonas harenae]NYT84883.1 PaaI family thioesterase [Pollutimonas harenae]TEA72719.1 PaaI family thioesterase [Pollutimonas harenae]
MTLEHNEPLPIKNPFLEWMGMTLTKWSPGYAEMHLPISERLGNRTGRVHGGVICTLLDSVSGYSGLYTPPGEPELRSLTLSLTTNFLDSHDGKCLIGKGYVERRGRSVFFTRAEVWVDDSFLVATAVGTFKYIRHR